VTVRCADGSQVTADLLVGADGSNSRVRGQRLPGLDRQELGVLNIAARVPLTPELADQVPAPLVDGAVNNVVRAGAGWMFVSTWHADTPRRRPSTSWYGLGGRPRQLSRRYRQLHAQATA
jgi:2-polyprenyl-6-methoxyphenol hydroxylase-like FAD-dependent oxidoreductase